MPFGGQSSLGTRNDVLDRECTFAPPGEYYGMMCAAAAAAAMRLYATITVATCYSIVCE